MINREFLRSALEYESATVDVASSGMRAVEHCQECEYDLILLDLHMPEQDGLETARAIQNLSPQAAAGNIVFLTADNRENIHQKLHADGFNRILNKPIGVKALFSKLRRWLAVDINSDDPFDQSADENLLIDDQAALQTCHDQPELVAKMMRLFADDLDSRLPKLDRHFKRGDISAVSAILHQWRGATGFAGAGGLARQIDSLSPALANRITVDGQNISQDDSKMADAYFKFLRCADATQTALRQLSD